MQPTCYLLVGLPGTGKSTFVQHLRSTLGAALALVSTDAQIDRFAAERGMTYSQAFPLVDMRTLEAEMLRDLDAAVRRRQHIVVDRTNLRYSSRDRLIERLTVDYRVVAVLFAVPQEVHSEWLQARAEREGKQIPLAVLRQMQGTYQPPTYDEVDELQTVDWRTGAVTTMERWY